MLSSCKLLSFPSKFHFLNESHTMSTRMYEITFVATWDETGSVGVINLTKTELEEYVTSPFFVLHDSKGFEPGDVTNVETVRQFIQQRSLQELPLRERLHGLWCVYLSLIPPVLLSLSSGSVQRRRQPAVVFSR